MRISKIIIGLLLSILLGSGVAVAADYDKGLLAYNSGDFKTALEEWIPLAGIGHAKAQYNLARLYANGYGVQQSDKISLNWYIKAAEQGNVNAQYNLGVMYQSGGEGVPKNYEIAVKWFTLAAAQGDAYAQINLGVMYATGMGVPMNNITAVKLFTKPAEQGYAKAQYNLGVMYDKGYGISENDKVAVEWYTKASEQGYASAQNSLALLYQNGEGVAKNYITSIKWYTLAAEQGNADAQFNLGLMYASGQGVLADYLKSYMWHDLASYNGNKIAPKYKDRIAKQMTPADISKAQDMSSRCLKNVYKDCNEGDNAQVSVNSASVKPVDTSATITVSDKRSTMAKAFISSLEPSVLYAIWGTNGRILSLAMIDDGTKRDGYARYACSTMSDYSLSGNGKLVQIVSSQSIQNKNWKVIGSAICN